MMLSNVVYIPDSFMGRFERSLQRILWKHKPARVVVPSNNLYGGCLVELEAIAAVK